MGSTSGFPPIILPKRTRYAVLLVLAALAGGEGEEDLREKLVEIERLSAQLRALESERQGLPAPNDQGLEFDLVPIADLLSGVQDFHRPSRGKGGFRGVVASEEAPQPYGTVEEIIEMIRTNVQPRAWEEGAQIGALQPSIFLFAKPDVNRAVRALIDKELRPPVRTTVNLEIDVVEAPEPMAHALAAAAGAEIDAALRGSLDEAIAAGKAKRLFAGRVRGLSRQQVVLWHGAQEAAVVDADVVEDRRADAADPIVDVEVLGAVVEARSTVTADRIRVEISLGMDVADRPLRTTRTEKAGALQMPARETARIEANLWMKGDRWAVAAGSGGTEGRRRFLLVRPTVIGGAR